MSNAYELAAKLDSADPTIRQTEIDAADELRKLAQVNAELLDALNNMLERCTIADPFTVEQARAAIEKATGNA